MLKKSVVLVLTGLFFAISANVCGAATSVPPAGKLVLGGSDPELIISVKDGNAHITFPYTLGQSKDVGSKVPNWTMHASVARYNSDWVLQGEDANMYKLQTTVVGSKISVSYPLPREGCEWPRFWGSSPEVAHLWIAQSSKYHRQSDNGSPGYEMLICADGTVHQIPAGYSKRP
jgi:hypothetical protein